MFGNVCCSRRLVSVTASVMCIVVILNILFQYSCMYFCCVNKYIQSNPIFGSSDHHTMQYWSSCDIIWKEHLWLLNDLNVSFLNDNLSVNCFFMLFSSNNFSPWIVTSKMTTFYRMVTSRQGGCWSNRVVLETDVRYSLRWKCRELKLLIATDRQENVICVLWIWLSAFCCWAELLRNGWWRVRFLCFVAPKRLCSGKNGETWDVI